MPFRYGIVTMTSVPHLFVRVLLEVDGRPQWGVAADHLPPKWLTKDPSSSLSDDVDDMLEVIRSANHLAVEAGSAASVFDLWDSIYTAQRDWAQGTTYPPLLWNFGVTLVERAMIDAFCRATRTPFAKAVYDNTLGIDLARPHAKFAGAARPELRGLSPRHVLKPPLRSVISRHTVGLVDPLTDAEIPAGERLDDGLPQSLEACIKAYDLTHFKIKLCGDVSRDRERLGALARIISATGSDYAFTLDGNENFHDVAPFRDLWDSLRADAPLREFLNHLIFVEQPIHRDAALSEEVRKDFAAWRNLPRMIIDESDGSFASLPAALDCGYAGTSHKNCKGIFKGIVNAALLSQGRRIDESYPAILSGEDLSNVGPVSLLQDLAAVATLGISHVERNGQHYFHGMSMHSPALQEAMLAHHGDLYHRHPRGFATLNIVKGKLDVGSVIDAPFGVGFDFDPSVFTPLDQWSFASLLAAP